MMAQNMAKDDMESTNRLLRVMVALLSRRKEEPTLTLRQQIKVLSDLGIKPSEIAEILGRSSSYVNKELSGIRKEAKKTE